MTGLRERVEADLAAGRLWKARDRLRGALRVSPANQWVLGTLGKLCFRMGDLPEAGRVWFLTDQSGPDYEAAQAAFYERYGTTSENIVAALNVRGRIEDYPNTVQERLGTLQRRLRQEGHIWDPRRLGASRFQPSRTWKDQIGRVIGVAVVLLLLAALAVGLFSIVGWIISVVTGR